MKELKYKLEGLVNYVKTQTQINNQNARNNRNGRHIRGVIIPPFTQSKYVNTSVQTQNNRDTRYHAHHEMQPSGQFTKWGW